MNEKFSLNPDVFLVKGAKRSAIYDLSNGDVYSIDEVASEVLEMCEQGMLLKDIITVTPEFSFENGINFLNNLQSSNVGKFLEKQELIRKIDLTPPEKQLEMIWLELTESCNQKCIHCYGDCNTSPLTKRIKKSLLSLKQWEKVIEEGYTLSCRRIQLTGGEPMFFGKDIFTLIKFIRELGYKQIEMFTNATLFDKASIDLLVRYDVRIATNIYSKRPEIHDAITKLEGSFDKTIRNIKLMQERGVKVFLATVLMDQNAQYAEETVDFIQELGEPRPLKHFDIIRPVGRGKESGAYSDKIIRWSQKTKPIFSKITKKLFIKRKFGHSCWWGNIAITSTGLVVPCIMAKEEICGDIKKESLIKIFEGLPLNKMWGLSKDHIKVCKDCEYRYACLDCRPLAKGQTNDFLAKNFTCSYDPYQGNW